MKKTKISANWQGDMSFDISQNGHNFVIDADEKVGGHDKGPRPKALLLSGLAGCTGMDVISILKKMKVTDYNLKIDVEAEQSEEFPKPYNKITVFFRFEGKNLPENKLKRAVELSETRYCGVSDMLRKAATIDVQIWLNGERIE
ncbi:MAG: OsmC family protein [Candidatus Cloacimonadota bacterium]|nr:OsmC family protein [Candidatus Cloacimonadota bacterium]